MCIKHIYVILQLLASNQGHVSMAAMNTVAEVLHKLLVVGITDTGEIMNYQLLTFAPY